MSERSYAPPLGIEGATGTLDPDFAQAFALALRMHEGRYLVVPKIVKVATPAVGGDWFFIVPSGTTWIINTLVGTLTASAVVANRQPNVAISDGSTTFCRLAAPANQTAGAVIRYGWNRDLVSPAQAFVGGRVSSGFPVIPLVGGYTVFGETINMDVGDQWSAIAAYVLEIRERTPNERSCYIEDILAGRPTTDTPGLLLGL